MVKKPGKAKPEACAREQQDLDDIDGEIASLRVDITDQGLTAEQKKHLQELLRKAMARRPRVVLALSNCLAKAGGANKKKKPAAKKKPASKKKSGSKKAPAKKKKKKARGY